MPEASGGGARLGFAPSRGRRWQRPRSPEGPKRVCSHALRTSRRGVARPPTLFRGPVDGRAHPASSGTGLGSGPVGDRGGRGHPVLGLHSMTSARRAAPLGPRRWSSMPRIPATKKTLWYARIEFRFPQLLVPPRLKAELGGGAPRPRSAFQKRPQKAEETRRSSPAERKRPPRGARPCALRRAHGVISVGRPRTAVERPLRVVRGKNRRRRRPTQST
jgi:hypothetical protein